MKRFLRIALALCMCVTMIPSAFAVNKNGEENEILGKAKSSEYEMLLGLSDVQEKQFLQESEIAANTIEQAIFEKASLSEEVLLAEGYSGEQIAILKAYDGGPLEDNPQLERALGSLEGELSRVSYSNTSAAAKFSWEWVNKPVLTGAAIRDIVACAWRGVNSGNEECVMTFASGKSSCSVKYNNGNRTYTENLDINVRDAQRNVEVKIPMADSGIPAGWAQSGELVVAIAEEVSVKKLYSSTFLFAYGHMVLTLSPSIEVSVSGPSLSFSFGTGTNEEYNKSIIIRTNGTTQEI